ncbi:acyl-CoA dehydrogenase family protein [Actinokineospora iranica]|uniref:Acyl-CoA dehydrogenase n=1 Tax=Actinokineospora iranica TaxID=1271860 RepID=A0A1G6QLE7_9PSEU|nr:acyl-CoA dehydrogenase family protein [Actinokineospora iranica]SDC93242.1 Acyl-CoA dehydrogenase [Actinokineospora iranica]
MTSSPGLLATPDSDELVHRAASLVPLLRSNAQRCAEARRVPAENLEALREAGLFRLMLPRHFGGYESTMRTKMAVLAEIARGCASTAWVATLYYDATFLLSLFPDSVQDEVFADPVTLHSATLVPTGRAVRVNGGYLVSGRWPFNSGCLDATYAVQPGMIENSDGPAEMAHFVIPYTELTVADDWHVSGMAGTGSNTVTGENIFVPNERAALASRVMFGAHLSERNAHSALYRVPLVPYVLTSCPPAFLGMAAAAYELFMARLPERGPIAYTGYTHFRDAPITHHQVAGAKLTIEAADHFAYQAADLVDQRARTGTPYGPQDKPRVWGLVSHATKLYMEAIETLRLASGATAINEAMPIQLVARNAQALATHALMLPTTGVEHYGRALCGLEPSTPLLA